MIWKWEKTTYYHFFFVSRHWAGLRLAVKKLSLLKGTNRGSRESPGTVSDRRKRRMLHNAKKKEAEKRKGWTGYGCQAASRHTPLQGKWGKKNHPTTKHWVRAAEKNALYLETTASGPTEHGELALLITGT